MKSNFGTYIIKELIYRDSMDICLFYSVFTFRVI